MCRPRAIFCQLAQLSCSSWYWHAGMHAHLAVLLYQQRLTCIEAFYQFPSLDSVVSTRSALVLCFRLLQFPATGRWSVQWTFDIMHIPCLLTILYHPSNRSMAGKYLHPNWKSILRPRRSCRTQLHNTCIDHFLYMSSSLQKVYVLIHGA